MGRGRGVSGRVGGSRRVKISVRGINSYSGRVQHATYRKKKAKSGISKSLENIMFTYGEKNSAE